MSEADRPLGCVLTGDGAEFGLHAPDASAAFVCLFDAAGEQETARIALTPDGAGAHRGLAPGVTAGQRYGFRVEGPFEPGRGLRFDEAKLLADPYALALDRPYALYPEMFAFGADTGAVAPKAIALAPPPAAPGFARIPWERTVLYELNLRGFSALREDIPVEARGRFAALAQPRLIEHLQGLGVTSVEIMPADAFVDERHLPPLGLTNAWGYNPVILGVPDPRLAPAGWADVRAATDALHAAGLEVILDIVLNHNGESDEFGPTLSFRGLDNAGYFRLHPDDRARYINDMGCGNCLALDRPAVVAMAMSALRRWMIFGGVDGFRFDLASAMGRREGGFDPQAPLFLAIASDPIVSKAKLIAEPWDIGPGGYQLGAFPQGWGEWNDRYRDTARRFWRGDGFLRGDLATRIAGSRDAFAHAPTPLKSVNFIVAHDGFTLADVVSYEHKHNEANGEDNRDGSNENYSWNHGVEGPSDDPAIRAARARDMRNLLTLLFASRGAPMLAMGAETGHSQRGNNNAYAQDNAISWLDWTKADAGLADFIGRLAAFRRAHPALSSPHWMTGQPFDETGLPDVEWRDAEGPMTTGEQWNAPFGDSLVAVLAANGGAGCDRVIFAVNRSGEARRLRLPEARPGMAWRLGLSTADPELSDAPLALSDRIEIGPRTSLLLAESPAGRDGPGARPPNVREVDALAEAAGIAAKWWEVSGRETEVSPETKLALLEALRLPARSKAQCRESLSRLVEETVGRRLPASLTLALDAPRAAPLRSPVGEAAREAEVRIATEAGETIVGRARLGEGRRLTLADGREILEGGLDLPELPIGRHRLEIAGVASALTIAPPECYGASAAW